MNAALLLFAWMAQATGSAIVDLSAALRLYGLGEYQKAADLLLQRSRQAAPTPESTLWLGKSYYRLRRWDDAIHHFERAVSLEPSGSLYHLWLGRACGRKAEHVPLFMAFGHARRLLKEFEAAVHLSPDNLEARFDLLEYYLEAPAIIGGGHDRARAQIEEISRRDVRMGHTARARLYANEKKFDLAQGELLKSTVEFPDQPGSYIDLAEYLFGRMDYAEVEPKARKAVNMTEPPDRKASLMLAASWVRLNKELPEAEKGLESLISGPLEDDDPPFEDAYYWFGQAELALGKKAEARKAFERALRFNPDHARTKAALSLMH
jgi:tetratricopeptide (TPR) repeat protein